MTHARHGFLRNLAWTVVDRTPSSITCAVDVAPAEPLGTFPFHLHVEQHVSVADGVLDARLVFRNTGETDQPISAGWHPYLHRDPGARLQIPAASYWELDASEEPVPTGRLQPVCGPSDFRRGRAIGDGEHWDITLTDLEQSQGMATSALDSELVVAGTRGGPRRLGVRRLVRSDLPHVQLYTAPGRPAIAVEPFSSPPNAVNLAADGHAHTGVRRLRPGESTPFRMALGLILRPL
jgi:aldose 1-epimerase